MANDNRRPQGQGQRPQQARPQQQTQTQAQTPPQGQQRESLKGAPGLYADAPSRVGGGSELYFDNIRVYRNAAK